VSEEKIYNIQIECSGGLHTLITEHDFDDYYNHDYFLRKTIKYFGNQWGNYPEKCKYKFSSDKKWREVAVKHYVL
jgi:hypothetical protein